MEQPIPELPLITHAGHCDWETGHSFSPHRHLGYEILYIKGGSGSVRLMPDLPPIAFEPDDLFITAPGVEHEFTMERCDAEYYWVGVQTSEEIGVSKTHILPPHRLVQRKKSEIEFINLMPEHYALATLTRGLEIGRFCRITRAAECFDPIASIYEELKNHRSNRAQAVYGQVLLLFTWISRRVGLGAEITTRSEVVRYAKNYVRAHYAEPITLEMMAETLNLHPSHVSRVFKRETGMTFREFLSAERVGRAKRLLESGQAVGSVAKLAGFGSVQAFSRAFRRSTGSTASTYRGRYVNLR